MKRYRGTKTVYAKPAYKVLDMVICCDTTTYETLINEYSADNIEIGYKVVYPDGYESWSPKSVFEESYRIYETQLDIFALRYETLTNEINSLASILASKQLNYIDLSNYYKSLLESRNQLNELIKQLKEQC